MSTRSDREIARRELIRSGVAVGAGLLGAASLAGSPTRAATPSGPTRPAAIGPREERFDLEVEGRVVPGILWHPRDVETPMPLVLAGHGGGFGTEGHKRVEAIVALAAELARHGVATLAIDQPGCGDRPGAREEQARRPEQGLALFDALGSEDKFVLGYPGDHGENLDQARDPWARFFASRLGALRSDEAS